MFAILGSGFGLYGYLPALCDAEPDAILLPERSRQAFDRRPELARFSHRLIWVEDDERALAQAHGVVIARRPLDQLHTVERCLSRLSVSRLVLEKPLAPSPEEAAHLLAAVLAAGKAARVAYTFRYAAWADTLAAAVSVPTDQAIQIHWRFLAHHHANDINTWKRRVDEGGGALGYYGIHVLALLAELGYTAVVRSTAEGDRPGELDRWNATLTGDGVPACDVVVDSTSAEAGFAIWQGAAGEVVRGLVKLTDPFEAPPLGEQSLGDRRVPVLARLFGSFEEEAGSPYDWYVTTNRLWHEAELIAGVVRG